MRQKILKLLGIRPLKSKVMHRVACCLWPYDVFSPCMW